MNLNVNMVLCPVVNKHHTMSLAYFRLARNNNRPLF